jgi:hypothetical protein
MSGALSASRRPAAGLAALLALGMKLAREGVLATASIVIAVATVIVLAVVGLGLAARDASAPLHTIPVLTSSALAWGGGFLLAFSSAAHALRRDRETGVRQLLEARSLGVRGYLIARVGGLTALLAALVGGGTLVVGLVMGLAAARASGALRAFHAAGAAVAFALAFAAVVGPVAYAAVGARSRMGGYLFLLAVIVLPELLASLLSGILPEAVSEVLAIPSALSALRSSLYPGSVDLAKLARALAALSVFTVLATMLVRRDAILLDPARSAEVPT